MKNLLPLMLCMCIIASAANAQTTFGVTAGTTFSNLTQKQDGIKVSSTAKVGFTAGVFVNLPLNETFSFQPALNFTQKGGKATITDLKISTTFNYLELPLNFVFTPNEDQGFFVGAGPALGYGISGKSKITAMGETTSEKVKFGSGEDQVKPFEFAANAFAGYKLPVGLAFSGGFNYGISNLTNESGSTSRNSYFFIRLSFSFPQSSN